MPRRFWLSRNGPNQDRRSRVRAQERHRIRGHQVIIDPDGDRRINSEPDISSLVR